MAVEARELPKLTCHCGCSRLRYIVPQVYQSFVRGSPATVSLRNEVVS